MPNDVCGSARGEMGQKACEVSRPLALWMAETSTHLQSTSVSHALPYSSQAEPQSNDSLLYRDICSL